MANLEVQIGADSSELNAEIAAAEAKIKRLSDLKVEKVKLGLDTKQLNKELSEAKTRLSDLKDAMKSAGTAAGGFAPKVANGSNALTQFSRIAQDAPFGIMGIGNNITSTAEAFGALSQQAGGAGGALKAVGASLAGPGGILLAISLVTTALTYMSQNGLTVGDVFEKLTGKFDQFKRDLQKVNEESAKQSGEQIATANAYIAAARNRALSDEERLIAVKKLQDEYPAYFGNLTKEQILNGNVTKSVNELTVALIAKAKAQAFSGKIGELASKEFVLRQKEAEAIKVYNNELAQRNRLEELYGDMTKSSSDRDRARLYASRGNLKQLGEVLKDVQEELKGNWTETHKWQDELNKVVSTGIGLDKVVEVTPKIKIKKEKVGKKAILPEALMADELEAAKALIKPDEIEANIGFIIPVVDQAFKDMLESMRAFNDAAKSIITDSIASTFGQLGTAIGEALVSGGNVLAAIGTSILQGLGNFLSEMGGLLIKYGTLAVVKGTLDTAILTGGPVAIGAGVAAIGVGVALKAAGGAVGGLASKGATGKGNFSNVSAGNSVSTPSSTVTRSTSSIGLDHVVFEISGASLIGVLNNASNRNIRIGG